MKFSLISGFLFLTLLVWGQQPIIDSLELELQKELSDSIRHSILTDLCYRYRLVNAEKGVSRGNEAIELAKKIGAPLLELESNYMIAIAYFFSNSQSRG